MVDFFAQTMLEFSIRNSSGHVTVGDVRKSTSSWYYSETYCLSMCQVLLLIVYLKKVSLLFFRLFPKLFFCLFIIRMLILSLFPESSRLLVLFSWMLL